MSSAMQELIDEQQLRHIEYAVSEQGFEDSQVVEALDQQDVEAARERIDDLARQTPDNLSIHSPEAIAVTLSTRLQYIHDQAQSL